MKGLRQKFRHFYVEDQKKRSSPGDENHFGGLLLHIYHWKKKQGRGPDDYKMSQAR